jgi:2-dehydro-3-deoxyphosphogluconate aldolase/(4S)-4-hydroxy-2-oxoglutarate aldolase
MNNVFEKIHAIGILPVIALDEAAQAVPLARALAAGGIPAAEVTFRTEAGEEAIRRIAQEVPEVLVGAGTILTTEQADRAVNAGARFIVSPGTNAKVVYHCQELGAHPIPGAVTPTEIETAMELGLDTLKFFPAEPSGGLGMIKALSAPYTQVKFIPTGGISAANVGEYLKYPKILACGGSWMVKKDLINARKFDEIQAMAAEAAAIVRLVREGR